MYLKGMKSYQVFSLVIMEQKQKLVTEGNGKFMNMWKLQTGQKEIRRRLRKYS